MKRISALLGGAVLGVALLAACGGGGGGSGTSAPAGIVPPSGPTSAPASSFTASDAVALPTPGAAAVPVPLPSAGGASGNLTIPAGATVPTDATVSAVYSTATDASVPALGARRATASTRAASEDSKKNVIAYLKLEFSADVTVPQAPGFTFIVPGTLATNGTSYWLAMIDPLLAAAGWQLGFEGPAAVAAAQTSDGKPATQLTFASNGKPMTFTANQKYYFAVYAVSATAATPTPVPTSVPSNPPPEGKPAPVVASPANVQFAAVTDSPVPVTFSQQGFTGAFSLHGNCTGIVNTSGNSPTFTLAPVGQGRCTIVGLGDKGATAVVHVGVVTPLETPHPNPSPTVAPTHQPTTAPTNAPSHSPEPEPSHSPIAQPSTTPSTEPSHSPEPEPSHSPVVTPTHAPEPTPTPVPSTTPTPGSAAGAA